MTDLYCREPLPHFQIELKQAASERWKPILRLYAQKIRLAYRMILESMISPTVQKSVLPIVFHTIEKMAKKGKVMHVEELQSISQACKIPFGGICLMQVAYELAAACTSAIHKGQHYRTMDWPMTSLCDLTISVEFLYGGKSVYRGITWAGMIGILTAVKRGVGSVSLNYRRQDKSLLKNVIRLWKGYWPAGYLIRDVMEQAMNFQELRSRLASTPLVAPSYLIACAPEKSPIPSCILIRNREDLVESRTIERNPIQSKNEMKSGPKQQILVQTNCDNPKTCRYRSEEDIFSSVDRADAAKYALTREASLDSFLIAPILNPITVYACRMNPTTGELEGMRIRKKGG